MRSNKGRETVADLLQKMDRKATIEEIWYTLYKKGHRLSESGVYLHLKWLLENGFVEKYKEKGRQAEYVLKVK